MINPPTTRRPMSAHEERPGRRAPVGARLEDVHVGGPWPASAHRVIGGAPAQPGAALDAARAQQGGGEAIRCSLGGAGQGLRDGRWAESCAARALQQGTRARGKPVVQV